MLADRPMMTKPRDLGAVLCSAVLGVLPSAGAWAAPSAEPAEPAALVHEGSQDTVCDTTSSVEEAALITARDLAAKAEILYGQGDYLGAIEAWEQVIVLMPNREAALRVQLAHAHRRAYTEDGDEEHLRSARASFADQLAISAPDDLNRNDLEVVVGNLDALIAEIDEAHAKAKAKREEEIRQEQRRRDQRLLAEAEAKNYRNIQTVYYGVGGSLAGVGMGSLAATTVFLAMGAQTDRQGEQTAGMVGVQDGRYEELLAQGQAQNRAAVATGVVGGVLVLSGAPILMMAMVRRWRRAAGRDGGDKVVVRPMVGGVRVRF